MVASISSSGNSVSKWADSVFSKLDTKNQGYIEKTDLQDALSKAGDAGKGGGAVDVDDTFSALDGDSDGKVTKSELTDAMTKLSDQLNAQFDAGRVGRGGPPPEGPPPSGEDGAGVQGTKAADAAGGTGGMAGPGGAGGPHGPGGAGGAGGDGDEDSSTDGTSSTSTDYIAAADTDGDGTVSDAEQAAYDKKVASGEADKSGGAQQKDPLRELAHALHLLKAYADNSGSDASAASTGDAGSTGSIASSVSVEA